MRIPKYRDAAEAMLRRWADEVAKGRSKPNVLAQIGEGGGGESQRAGPPQIGAMFTPMAERCECILNDFRSLDPRLYDYLAAFAFGHTVDEIAKASGQKRSKTATDLESSLAMFSIAVYISSKRAAERSYWLA